MTGGALVVAGQELPARTIGPISQADILRFAGASGDFNPLHYDADLAKRAGFDAPVAMGQMTAGIMAAWLADWCGVEHLAEFQVRFVAPVMVGDVITLGGSVSAIERIDGRELAKISMSAAKGDAVVAEASAMVVLTRQPGGDRDNLGAG